MAISPKMNPRISSPISSFRTAARKTGSWYPTVIPRLPATIAPVNAASAGVAASFCAMPSAPISGARRQLGMSAGSNGICFAASAIDSAWVCTYVTPIAKNPTVDIARPPMVASPFSKFGISPSFPPSISSTRPAAANTSMIAMNMFISRTSQLFPISLFPLIFPLSGTFLCQSPFFFYLASSCISTPPIVSISAPQERVTICANGSSSIRFELLSTATFPEPPMFVVHIPAAIDDSSG